jgi:hypothetical protein
VFRDAIEMDVGQAALHEAARAVRIAAAETHLAGSSENGRRFHADAAMTCQELAGTGPTPKENP